MEQLFQENVDVPVASVSTKDITLSTLFEMVEANQFLQLPRLSSQDIFDQLCPGLTSLAFIHIHFLMNLDCLKCFTNHFKFQQFFIPY